MAEENSEETRPFKDQINWEYIRNQQELEESMMRAHEVGPSHAPPQQCQFQQVRPTSYREADYGYFLPLMIIEGRSQCKWTMELGCQ